MEKHAPRVVLKKKARPTGERYRSLVVTCPGGAEFVLADEMRRLGFDTPRIETGAVRAGVTDGAGIALANAYLRSASRVLLPLLRLPATDFDDVYRGAKQIPWKRSSR